MKLEAPSKSVQRAKQKSFQRDSLIRKNADEALSKVKSKSNESVNHEVGQFDLCEPETILQSNTLVEAARHMAAKRLDFVLVADGHGILVGILTDKDLAYRVIAAGLDPRTTSVGSVMTKNPVCVSSSLTIVEALEIMSRNNFRHLPVKEDEKILGVLDIAKCLNDALQKLELADAAAHQIASALETVVKELGPPRQESSNKDAFSYAESLRDTLCSPLLASVLSNNEREEALNEGDQEHYFTVNIKYNVFEATKIMKERRETALLVTDEQGALVGIFTTKDIILRIVAAGLDANTTSIIRVMTPHPDYVTPTTSIVAALRQIHAGNYLHLPVLAENGKKIMGVVGVKQLTCAVLEQLKALRGSEADQHLWNQFWSPPSIADIEVSSHTASTRGVSRQPTYVLPKPEAAVDSNDDFCLLSGFVTLKVKLSRSDATAFLLPSVDIHNIPSLEQLEIEMINKFNTEPNGLFYYLDDENDLIRVSSDEELVKLINLTVANGQERITLLYEEPNTANNRSPTPFKLPFSIPPTNTDINPSHAAITIIGVALTVGLVYLFRSR